MNKKTAILISVIFVVLGVCKEVLAGEILWEEISRNAADLKTVLIDPDDPRVIYFGTEKGVLKTDDAGMNWRIVLSSIGQKTQVNHLTFAHQNKKTIYASTGNGLFSSDNQGKSWVRIFRGKNSLENECTTVSAFSCAVILGTKAGLFISPDNGRSWARVKGRLGESAILNIAYDFNNTDHIFIASLNGVYRSMDKGESWERIFIASPAENGNEDKDEEDDRDETERFSGIRHVSIDPNNADLVYLATAKGIYKSQDKGASWALFPENGLLGKEVKYLLISSRSLLYAITESGIFEYDYHRWKELSLHLVGAGINSLGLDNIGNIYAACDRGLFKSKIEDDDNSAGRDPIELYLQDEASIAEVQEAAIRYAEVEPGKIKRWREQAARKAWLPSVNVGLDRSTTDLWHWETGSTTKTEDDALRRGRDAVDWDIALSWDLSELIWSDAQTSIDVRSRLLVQLREDILDEVTKIYFERLRVKMELDNLSIEERKKRLDKQLRLRELTALLDGLTGGYFSGRAKKFKEG